MIKKWNGKEWVEVETIPDGAHVVSLLDETGDTKLIWDPKKEDEVDAARELFDNLTDKGYIAFTVADKGKQGDKIKKFDEDLGQIIMVKMLKGG